MKTNTTFESILDRLKKKKKPEQLELPFEPIDPEFRRRAFEILERKLNDRDK